MQTVIYESAFIVNSFHAKNADTGEILEADEEGFLSPAPNTRIVFPNPNVGVDKHVDLNTIVFTTRDEGVQLAVNRNKMYPIYVPPNSTKGIEYMRIYEVEYLEGGAFSYDGLSSET